MKLVKIHHISDSHSFHKGYQLPSDIDMLIFSGDCSNHRDPGMNFFEVMEFFDWFKELDIKYKIFVAGNHDTSIEKRLFHPDLFKEAGIIYLEDESIEIEGLKIHGSPRTPQFGSWAFMHDRNKIHRYWDNIPEDADILITHGPPKGVLDLSEDYNHTINFCGCSNLGKRVVNLPNLQLMCFGHIHNGHGIINTGVVIRNNIIYSNATSVEDGKFSKGIIYHGNTFYYNKENKKITL